MKNTARSDFERTACSNGIRRFSKPWCLVLSRPLPKIEINTVEQCGLDRTDAVTSAMPPPAMGSNTIEQPPNACIMSPLTDPLLAPAFVYSEESPWKPT